MSVIIFSELSKLVCIINLDSKNFIVNCSFFLLCLKRFKIKLNGIEFLK